jgi:peroxiredoxin
MRLTPGLPAPDFTADSLDGGKHTLGDYAGQLLWLGFFRFATCPLCNLRVHQLVAEWPRVAGSINLLAIFQSPPERFEGYVSKRNPPFPVISDPEMKLFKIYRVETSMLAAFSGTVFSKMGEARKHGMPLFDGPKDGGSFRVPADFLIDQGGVLRVCRYGKNIADSIPTEEVEKFLGGASRPAAKASVEHTRGAI